MRVSCKSAGRKVDARDAAARLDLYAANEKEAIFLAVMHNILIAGGTITLRPSPQAQRLNKLVAGDGSIEFSVPGWATRSARRGAKGVKKQTP